MALATNLGFPRIGRQHELKKLTGSFCGHSEEGLLEEVTKLRRAHWTRQSEMGIDHIPSNDFSLRGQLLDTAAMVGAATRRSGLQFAPGQEFHLADAKALREFREAKAMGVHTRPVLLGPISFLRSGKSKAPLFSPIYLLDSLLPVYEELLADLHQEGADWVQLDEPCLTTPLDTDTKVALYLTYSRLAKRCPEMQMLVAACAGRLGENVPVALRLPVAGIHVDCVPAAEDLAYLLTRLPASMSLSLGLVDRRSDLAEREQLARRAVERLGGDRVMIAPAGPLNLSPAARAEDDMLDDVMLIKRRLS